MYNPEAFLPCGGSGVDMAAAIEEKLQKFGTCLLGSGTYFVSGITMPDGASLLGVGYATKLLLMPELETGYTVKLGSFCTVRDLSVCGSEEPIPMPEVVGGRHGLCFLGDADPKVKSQQHRNSIISGCYISGFTGGGITCNDTGYSTKCAMAVSDCHIFNCGAGINISHFSEYHMFTNILCNQCRYGCINNGGNNVFVNCGFNSNKLGFLIDNSQGQSINNSHGSAVGCTFNHTDGNGGIGIQICGARSGYSFTGCQMFFSHILLENSDDIHFTGLNTGRQVEISVTGGKLTMFTGCTFGNPPYAIRIQDNDLVKFVNCYTRDGQPVGNS